MPLDTAQCLHGTIPTNKETGPVLALLQVNPAQYSAIYGYTLDRFLLFAEYIFIILRVFTV